MVAAPRKQTTRGLKPGDAVPPGPPQRYASRNGYRLRWKIAPYTYVSTDEHRVVDGFVVESKRPVVPSGGRSSYTYTATPTPAQLVKFWAKVVKTDTCWLWTGRHSKGYGGFYSLCSDGRSHSVAAHRMAYTLTYGAVSAELVMDHFACENKGCVNPDHIRPVTHRENVLRSEIGASVVNLAKTHCIHGHEYTPENTYPDPAGGRRCRECARIRYRLGVANHG